MTDAMTKPNGWTGVTWDVEGVHVFVDDRVQVCCGRGHNECCGSPDIEGDRHLVATAETEDYARLIAAAPSLYEALAEILVAYEDPGNEGHTHDDTVAKARAALSAAEGGV